MNYQNPNHRFSTPQPPQPPFSDGRVPSNAAVAPPAPKKKKSAVTALFIVAVLAIALIAGLLATHIHTCDRCGKTYFGIEYRIEDRGMDKTCFEQYLQELEEL